jgi:tetratricopeptide (TPR) repeat protein
VKRISVAAYLLLSACAATAPRESGPVELSASEQATDPVTAARGLMDHPEESDNLEHAARLVEWHAERHPERADLHLLAAEAHSRACEHLDKGSVEHRRHRIDGLRHAEEAVKLAPNDGAAHYWKGTLLLHHADAESSLGRAKAGLKELEKADELAPKIDDGGPARMRGKVLVDMPGLFGGSVPKGIASFKRSLEIAPDNITTRLWLGQAYAGAGKNDLAKQQFDAVIAAKPRPGHEKEDAASQKEAQDGLQKLK